MPASEKETVPPPVKATRTPERPWQDLALGPTGPYANRRVFAGPSGLF